MNSPMTPQQETVTLLQLNQQLLQEMRRNNQLLGDGLQLQQRREQQLAELLYLLNGFTSGGASFSGYLVDPLTQAYLAVMGPLIGAKLAGQEQDLAELMKGATRLARQLGEELAAYRSEWSAYDYLEEQTELLHDPWASGEER